RFANPHARPIVRPALGGAFRMRFPYLALTVPAAACLTLAACGDGDAPRQTADRSVDAHTGAPLAATQAAAGDLAGGQSVYDALCAACHDTPPDETTPPRAVLEGLSPNEIVAALRHGVMRLQGAALTPDQHVAVAEYLTGEAVSGAMVIPASAMCAADTPIPADATPAWNGWGGDVSNDRY